jgi:catechol 2,3-dioxygenase-like lactoylglutathione lyase family enzyme
MSGIELQGAIPILRFYDEAATRRFYEDDPGFKVEWEHRFAPALPLYMQLVRGGLTLHLSQHHGDATPGSAVFVRMRGVEALHTELSAKDYPFLKPGIDTAPWGARTLTLLDPAGNRLFLNDYGG